MTARTLRCLTLITLLLIPLLASAQTTVHKKYCTIAGGLDVDSIKRNLLAEAKRTAVNELFGELISSFTKVENFTLTEDRVKASSAGYVRIKGNPIYSQGKNFAETCVAIEAYATDEDRDSFKPKRVEKKQCASDPNLTTREIKQVAQEQAIVQALIDYDRKLEGIDHSSLLPLLHEVRYLESGFVPDTEAYCVRLEGLLYPIEVTGLLPSNTPSTDEAASTSQLRVDYSKLGPLVAELPNRAFTASSIWGKGHEAFAASYSDVTSYSSWSTKVNDTKQWLQINLGTPATVYAVGTKGRRAHHPQWVKAYTVTYSLDGKNWKGFQKHGFDVEFPGNVDLQTEVRNQLPTPIRAKFVRIHPLTWHNHITLRAELYGTRP